MTASSVSIPLSDSYAEDGICVQRLFSNFADGWPGAGLLVQRLLAGGALIYCAVTCATSTPICSAVLPESMGTGVAVLLIAGLWTPIAGIIVAILEAYVAFMLPGTAGLPIFVAVLGATLAMIGPGSWSVDALVFGRKQIEPRLKAN
jgi:putative oxidoreductase